MAPPGGGEKARCSVRCWLSADTLRWGEGGGKALDSSKRARRRLPLGTAHMAAAPVSASHAVKCARCVTALPHESKSRYLVGTLGLRDTENQIHLLEYEEDRNAIDALKVFPVKHEIWEISASSANPDLICTIYNDTTGASDYVTFGRVAIAQRNF